MHFLTETEYQRVIEFARQAGRDEVISALSEPENLLAPGLTPKDVREVLARNSRAK